MMRPLVKMRGYTLLELMIALGLTALLGTIVAQWLACAHIAYAHTCQRAGRFIALSSAQELLQRDLRQASATINEWKLFNTNEYVWHAGDHDIGWVIEKNNLYRCQGSFDAQKKRWLSVTKSLVGTHVQQLIVRCSYASAQRIEKVEASFIAQIAEKQESFTCLEYLRNGISL